MKDLLVIENKKNLILVAIYSMVIAMVLAFNFGALTTLIIGFIYSVCVGLYVKVFKGAERINFFLMFASLAGVFAGIVGIAILF